MRRTQIYLRNDQEEILQQLAKKSGQSLSQLIREAIDKNFGPGSDELARNEAIGATSGLWRSRRFGGSEYVSAMRGGAVWSRRLHALGSDQS